MSRRLGITATNSQTTKLRKIIETPGDPFRDFLAGPLGARLFKLLAEAAKKKREVYAALYELDDEQLEAALEKLGGRAHVVLANGSVEKKGEDQNSGARQRLAGRSTCTTGCFAARARPQQVPGRLRERRNAALGLDRQPELDQDRAVHAGQQLGPDRRSAAGWRVPRQWDLLRDAGDETPAEPRAEQQQSARPRSAGPRPGCGSPPTIGQVDLAEPTKIVEGARRAVLFLMFNPGPGRTLLNTISTPRTQGAAGKRLYIRGAINQDPSTTKNPVELFDSRTAPRPTSTVVLPAAIDEPTTLFRTEDS